MFNIITGGTLPPYVRAWQDPSSSRRKVLTAAVLLQCGRTQVFKLIESGAVKAVRPSPKRTLVETASILAYLESLAVVPPKRRRNGS